MLSILLLLVYMNMTPMPKCECECGDTMTRSDDDPCSRSEIRAGTQLTTSYLPSSLPRLARRHQLHHTWGFWCR